MMFIGKTMSSFDSEISQETVQAYQETEFRVFAENSLVLKISIKSEDLLTLYKDHRSETCAFVTACNPIGDLLSEEKNFNLQKQLEEEIKFRGLNFIPGEGKHPIGSWQGEASFLIFDLSLESAKTLGRKFNQNAIVWCDQNAIPQLILLR
jgi:Protein of unknown function (DUF3293)